MEILLGLLIATVIVFGWLAGSVFVGLFLTVGELVFTFLVYPTLHAHGVVILGAILCVIWLPFYLHQEANKPRDANSQGRFSPQPPPQAPRRAPAS